MILSVIRESDRPKYEVDTGGMEVEGVIDTSAVAAYEIFNRLLGLSENDPVEFDPAALADWANIRVYIPDDDRQSVISAPYMEAFLEVQRQFLQFSALLKTGVADIRQLPEHEVEALRIYFKVTGGSSNYEGKLKETVERLLSQMVDKMNGRHAVIAILGLAILVTAGFSWNAWLESQRVTRLEELRSQEHLEVLKAVTFARKEEIEMYGKVVDALKNQGAEGQRALDAALATNEALLKAVSKTKDASINGQQIKRSEAETLRASPRKKPAVRYIQQEMRVIDINTHDPLNIAIVLLDVNSKDQFRVKLGDSLFADTDRVKLFEALNTRATIWLELAVKEVEGEARGVELLRVVEPTSGVASKKS